MNPERLAAIRSQTSNHIAIGDLFDQRMELLGEIDRLRKLADIYKEGVAGHKYLGEREK